MNSLLQNVQKYSYEQMIKKLVIFEEGVIVIPIILFADEVPVTDNRRKFAGYTAFGGSIIFLDKHRRLPIEKPFLKRYTCDEIR